MSDELPKGWASARIADMTERVPNIKPEDSPEKEFGYVDISSIDNSTFAITGVKLFLHCWNAARVKSLSNAARRY